MPEREAKTRKPTYKPRELRGFARAIGKLIAKAREQSGLTQEKAAEAGRLDPRQWQRLERGEADNMTLAVLLRIAHALAVPPRVLIPTGAWRGTPRDD